MVLFQQNVNRVLKAENILGCHGAHYGGTSSVGEMFGFREPWSGSALGAIGGMSFMFSRLNLSSGPLCAFLFLRNSFRQKGVQTALCFFVYSLRSSIRQLVIVVNLVYFVELSDIIASWQLKLYLS